MNLYNKKIGRLGEQITAIYLFLRGYKILKMNYKNKVCEIDIIAKKGDTFIFVEVKTRTSLSFGDAASAVNYFKQKKMILGAKTFLGDNINTSDIRFDVCEVYLKKLSFLYIIHRINYIKNCIN